MVNAQLRDEKSMFKASCAKCRQENEQLRQYAAHAEYAATDGHGVVGAEEGKKTYAAADAKYGAGKGNCRKMSS